MDRSATNKADEVWPTVEDKERCVAQAKALRNQAAEGGLCFEAYLPPHLAEWLLERIEKGVFLNPSEAIFVLLGEQEELELHIDLRRELLRRSLDAAMNDPRPSLPAKEVFDELRKKFSTLPPEPAVWLHREQ
jgi:antitoxin ParD1/3/4